MKGAALIEPDTGYPGDVPEAMPEGALSFRLTIYVSQTIRCVAVDLARDSVHGNMPIYYDPDRRRRPVAPDVFVVRGLPDDLRRRSYRLWEPGAIVPQVAFEIVSINSEWKDVVRNRKLYERIGIREYYWYAPKTHELTAYELHPRTRRYRKRCPDRHGRYPSRQLEIEIGREADGLLGLYRAGVYLAPAEELIKDQERTIEAQQRMLHDKQRMLREQERMLREQTAALRSALLALLEVRFGPLPPSIADAVEDPANEPRLASWLRAAGRVANLHQIGISSR